MSQIDEQDALLRKAHDARIQEFKTIERQFVKQFENDSAAIAGLPGPFSFLTSGYALGLVAMVFLLNRMQHLVVPTRDSLVRQWRRSNPIVRHVWASFLPVDLSSTTARFVLHSPSLALLLYSLLLMSVTLLQTSGLFPKWQVEWLQSLGDWASKKHMRDICWITFGAVCSSLTVEQLVRGLEGSPSSASSSFNLFGYAFLLHIYSSPITHLKPNYGNSSNTLPSRPDKHVLITMIIPLIQLTVLHILSIRKSWSRQILVPTMVCSVLALLHFHYVLFLSPATYPLLNYIPSLVETLLIMITVITVALNAMTQLLLEGAITRPLFGFHQTDQMNLFGVHSSALPRSDDDFSVAILRLGTASLEATAVAGLGNEVSPVPHPMVRLDRMGVKRIHNLSKRPQGFDNEITDVKVAAAVEDSLSHLSLVRFTAAKKYLLTLYRVIKGIFGSLIRKIRRKERFIATIPTGSEVRDNGNEMRSGLITPPRDHNTGNLDDDSGYQRFLRGQSVSDDENDDDYAPTEPIYSRATSLAPSELDEGAMTPRPFRSSEDQSDDEDDAKETVELFEELMTPVVPPSQGGSTSILLAHLTSSSSSPLTRRRYNSLMRWQQSPSPDDDDAWGTSIRERRPPSMARTSSFEDQLQRDCVICTVQPRNVICWPCRCLAVCDDCRSNLASRSPATKHICPCCRQNVEGYSRIYIP
ncbi:hypothetical protein SISNIDRAFT_525442 [Sistotremastrum niveocremeum HHB9708]|uniref:RING-type domain-containing protein n=1 Tax=Sistotremastrum niveocremeum HHB9708 TaxID=1314777 RepID=A0A164QU68_9AGAM|nr:hypothetical protein SISNIDRAFT_525442 [Sistotremastrum niveocremeum HHB9708]